MKKILIVEDNDALRYMIGLRLKYAGFSVEAVEGVKEAEKYLKREQPLIMCTDVNLKDGNGLLLLSYIKRNNPTLPVLVMSSYEKDEYEDQAKRLGAECCLDKSEGSFMVESIIDYANKSLAVEERIFQYRIMYISDSEERILEMERIFGKTEIRVLSIRNQILAEDLLIKKIGVQVILCDADIEEGGALKLLHTFRYDSFFKMVCKEVPPCIVLVDETESSRERYISAGAEDVISRSNDQGAIVQKIREVIAAWNNKNSNS